MNAELSRNRKFKRMSVNILSIFVILAMAFPSIGSVSAQEPAPRIVVQITDDWFRAENFLPNTSLDYWIYNAPAGNLLMGSGTMPTDGNGTVTTWVGNRVNLQPGQYIVVADSSQEKTLVLEDLTFDLFDITNGHLEGTAPAPDGRDVWTGIGFENNMWDKSVTTENGNWSVDFGQAVPSFAWVAAQIFDEDGDASEVRPQQIFGQWIAIYTLDLPPGAWAEGDHSYYLGDNWGFQGEPVSFSVSGQAQYYEGYVLLRGRAMWAGGDNGCVNVSSIHPAQATRFHSGWPTEDPMTYDQAVNYFSGLSPWVARDDGEQTNLELYEIVLYFPETWPQYYCTFTKTGWPNPHFSAFPEWEYIEGWNWPLGANIHLTIDDPSTEASPDLEQDQPVVVTPWNPDDKWVTFNFAGVYDMKPGDVVTLSDGLILRTLTVQNLDVIQAEIRDDTVYGTADPGAVVHSWVHDYGESEMVLTAGENGTWMAEFWKTGLDMVEGMCGRSEIRNDMGNATAVDWCYPIPHFTVFPDQDVVEGFDWHPNDYVYLTIDQESSEDPVTFYTQARTERTPWNPDQWWVRFDLAGQFDIKPGDSVHLDDDSVERTMTVRHLSVTNVDPVANVIGGTATPGAVIQVWPHETGQQLQDVTNSSGHWQVDFTGVFDIVPGTCGRSQIVDAFDNATASDWCAPKPWLTAFPENDAVEGWEWPNGATVTLTIDNAPGLEWSGTAAVTTWGDPRTFVRIEFGNDYNLQIGDKVTLTDEFGTTRTHTVQNLAITKVNAEDDLIKGIADAGVQVHVWPHATGQEQVVTAHPNGKWDVDFSGIFDLVPGTGGRSEVRDEFGNTTAVDWYVPNPRMTIFPEWEWFDGMDWPDGAKVIITVAGKPECKVKKVSWGYFFNGGFPESCDIVIGDTVSFTDGTTTRTQVVQNLSITGVDEEADTISGAADVGAVVDVWPHATGQQLQATADSTGRWQVNFTDVFDLVPGECGRSQINDAVGNATAVDWCVPWPPRIVVQITDDWFRAENFLPNTPLNFWIYDAPDGNLLLNSTTEPTDGSGTVTHWVGDQLDLIPGNYVVVSDGSQTRELVLEAFTFDVFDTSLGVLQGTAPEPFGRVVSVGIGCWTREDMTMDTTTNEIGAWTADFGASIPNDYGCVYAWIYDVDGDVSEVRPGVRYWVAAYTYDAGSWTEEPHTYHFEATWNGGSETTTDVSFNVSSEEPVYDGYVLLRPGAVLAGPNCSAIDVINPNQPTRLLNGYLTDYPMTYSEAESYFDNLTARAIWDDGITADLVRHEIIPFSWDHLDDWFQYVCTFTSP